MAGQFPPHPRLTLAPPTNAPVPIEHDHSVHPSSLSLALLSGNKLCSCGVVFPTLDRLAFHIWSSNIHGPPRRQQTQIGLHTAVQCICGQELANVIRLVAHLLGSPIHNSKLLSEELDQIVHLNGGLHCLICMRRYSTRSGLDAHFNQHHFEFMPGTLDGLINEAGHVRIRRMTCPCGEVFRNLTEVVMHDFSTKVHSGNIDNILQRANYILTEGMCSCGKTGMKSLEAYDQHCRTNHSQDAACQHLTRDKVCSCGHVFSTLQQFCSHLTVARGIPGGRHPDVRTDSERQNHRLAQSTTRPALLPAPPRTAPLNHNMCRGSTAINRSNPDTFHDRHAPTPTFPIPGNAAARRRARRWESIEAELDEAMSVSSRYAAPLDPGESTSAGFANDYQKLSPRRPLPDPPVQPTPAAQQVDTEQNLSGGKMPPKEEWLLIFDSDSDTGVAPENAGSSGTRGNSTVPIKEEHSEHVTHSEAAAAASVVSSTPARHGKQVAARFDQPPTTIQEACSVATSSTAIKSPTQGFEKRTSFVAPINFVDRSLSSLQRRRAILTEPPEGPVLRSREAVSWRRSDTTVPHTSDSPHAAPPAQPAQTTTQQATTKTSKRASSLGFRKTEFALAPSSTQRGGDGDQPGSSHPAGNARVSSFSLSSMTHEVIPARTPGGMARFTVSVNFDVPNEVADRLTEDENCNLDLVKCLMAAAEDMATF